MFFSSNKQSECASACSAAASFSCANLFVMDAVVLASILFFLAVLGLRFVVILVIVISILRMVNTSSKQPVSLA